MSPSYNMATGHEASYSVSSTGNTTVAVRSSSPMKFRAVYVGAASLEFIWVSSGKSSHWQFTPTILEPAPAKYSIVSDDDGQTQIVNVELGNRMFPVTGLINTNVKGEIKAPAIHFDLPHAYDLWVFLLRSPWTPVKIGVEKSQLSISHGSAQAEAQLEGGSSTFDDGSSLRADVSVHGEGFKKVWLSLHRSVNNASIDETIGEITDGLNTFNWKPFLRNLDVALVTYSNMAIGQLLDFLKYFGAEIHQGFFQFDSFMSRDFVLCDGPLMSYTLRLIGEKHFFGHEKDETRITLNY
jgi:hypothetical protein